MPFRPWEQYADVASVAASGIGTLDLPTAGTYYAIYLNCLDGGAAVSVANIKDNITNVKISLDGVNVIEADADFLYDLADQQYSHNNVYAPQAGVLPIFLAPDFLTNRVQGSALGYGMAGINSFQIELTFSANVTGAGHTDQIKVFVERSPITRPLGEYRRITKLQRSFASTGQQEITDLPREGGSDVATTAWHVQFDGSATADLTHFEALLNSQSVIANLPKAIHQARLAKAGRKWMVGAAAKDLFSVPFDLSNDLQGYMSHADVNDLRFRLTWATAAPGSYSLYRESIHNIGQRNR